MRFTLHKIGIIGGGYSALAVAYELIQLSRVPVELLIFDPTSYAGKGIAYSTDCPLHLLNVPVGRMGALRGKSEDFFEWLLAEPHKWRSLDPSFKRLEVGSEKYFPRMIYGMYLQDFKQSLEKLVFEKNCQLRFVKKECVDICRDQPDQKVWRIITTDNREIYHADHIILAMSSPWTQKFPAIQHERYLEQPWPIMTNVSLAKQKLDCLGCYSKVGIIGSGLTMLDALAMLKYLSFDGQIEVISNKKLLPLEDRESEEIREIKLVEIPTNLLKAFKIIRKLIDKTGDWLPVFRSLRLITQELWERLTPTDKRKFIERLLSFWNIHRHRVPSEVKKIFEDYQEAQSLSFIKGKVVNIESCDHKINIVYSNQKENNTKTYDLVINCTGPNFNIEKHSSPFIQRVLKKQYIQPDTLGMGIDPENETIHPLGALTFGTYFEITSVPDIREQCYKVARKIIQGIQNENKDICI